MSLKALTELHLVYLRLLFASVALAPLFIYTNNSIPDSLFWKADFMVNCSYIVLLHHGKCNL